VTAALLLVCALCAFASGLGNPFDNGDDQLQIVRNLPVHSFSNIGILFHGSTFYTGHGLAPLTGTYYRPLMMAVYSAIYTAFGANPVPFHLVQLFFVTGGAFLLYLLFRACSFAWLLAFALALIFLVHPIDSQVVYSIPAMAEALYFFFGMLAVVILVRTHSMVGVVMSALCLLCALLSKESAAMFAVVALIYSNWWDRRRTLAFGLMVLLAVGIWLTFKQNAVGLGIGNAHGAPIDDLPLGERLLNTPAIILLYLSRLVWPFNQASSYYWFYTSPTLQTFVVPVIVDSAVVAVAVVSGLFVRRFAARPALHRTYWFFLAWTSIGLAAHSQIIPLDATANEVWFLFSMAGLLGLLGIVITASATRLRVDRRAVVAAVGVLLILLGTLTFERGTVWADPVKLAQQNLASSPDFHSYGDVGYDYAVAGNCQLALEYAQKSVALYPNAVYLNTLGEAYAALGNFPAANEAYGRAVNLVSVDVFYEKWAQLVATYADPSSARTFFQYALSLYPNDGALWFWLADYEYKHGDVAAARADIGNAVAYSPDNQYLSDMYTRMMQGVALPRITQSCA
jgi:hypothetical protein